MHNDPIILYIDDDEDDVEAFAAALQQILPTSRLYCAQDGEEGVKRLHQLKETQSLPRLIVLDMNMPKVNGKEALVLIQKMPCLRMIPIYVLTTSDFPKEKDYFESQGVKMFTKPFGFDALMNIIKEMLKAT